MLKDIVNSYYVQEVVMLKRLLLAALITAILLSSFIVQTTSAENMPVITKLFGYARSDKEDIIYFRNGDNLSGTVIDETVSIATPYGEVKLPIRKCAGISFEGSAVITEQVVTVNFNVFSGIILNKALKFKISSSGEIIEARKEKIKYVLLMRTGAEQDFVGDYLKTNLFIMTNGDLITGRCEQPQIVISTDYSNVRVSFTEIKDMIMQGGVQPTVVITKKNGDTMRGKIETEDLTLQTDMKVDIPDVYKDKYSRVYVDDGNEKIVSFFLEKNVGVPETPSTPVVPVTAGIQDLGLTIPGSGGVQLSMKLIPSGSFMMGSPNMEQDRDDDEGPQHRVTISKAFYMGVFEVTQEQWKAVMGTSPSSFGYNAKYPVEEVSWEDCQRFISKINAMGIGTFRLPTEAEWEYACRSGSTTRFPWGDDSGYSSLGQYAWYSSNSNDTTHPVGLKKPNAWGLYDMHGNVWEWCSDWYAPYASTAQTDPKGPSTAPSSGSSRVLRGGSWYSDPRYCRSANRGSGAPTGPDNDLGFRLVRTL